MVTAQGKHIRVTPSMIGILLECPRCLWLYYREGLQRPRGPFPSLPGGMDRVFKHYFDHWRKLGKLPPELREISGYLYDNLEQLNTWRSNFRGLVSNFPALNMTLQGAIDDLLVVAGGRYAPLDFKTRGYPAKEDTHKHFLHQLNLYALLLEANGLPPAEAGYLLFFHPTSYRGGGIAHFETKLVEMPLNLPAAREVLQEVRRIVDGPPPRAHTECAYCHYRADVD